MEVVEKEIKSAQLDWSVCRGSLLYNSSKIKPFIFRPSCLLLLTTKRLPKMPRSASLPSQVTLHRHVDRHLTALIISLFPIKFNIRTVPILHVLFHFLLFPCRCPCLATSHNLRARLRPLRFGRRIRTALGAARFCTAAAYVLGVVFAAISLVHVPSRLRVFARITGPSTLFTS